MLLRKTDSLLLQNPTTQPASAPPLLFQHHKQLHPQPPTLSTCGSGRRTIIGTSSSNSPEFEFWRVGNPTRPQPDLLSADQLFLDGVLLPLHLLHLKHPNNKDDPPLQPYHEEEAEDATSEPGPQLTATPATTEAPSASKRWTDIFKRSEKKSSILTGGITEDKSKDKQRREKRGGLGNSTELHINLWPFLRSRSEGNGAVRPRLSSGGPTPRRVSSAPCSRSNSGGDSNSRKWPGSPARPGLHLGRASPVWQVKRSRRASIDSGEPRHMNNTPRRGGSRKAAKVLNLNVPMCSGYRHHLGCRTDDNVIGIGHVTRIGYGAGGGGHGVNSSSGGSTTGNMFNLRSLFTKKVH